MGDPDVDPDIVCPPYICNSWSFTRYAQYDEYLAIIVDGASCCGGAFTVSIFNWFDAGDDNLQFGANPAGVFDWEQTEIAFSVGIGANITLLGGLSVTSDDLEYLKIVAQFVFLGFDILRVEGPGESRGPHLLHALKQRESGISPGGSPFDSEGSKLAVRTQRLCCSCKLLLIRQQARS